MIGYLSVSWLRTNSTTHSTKLPNLAILIKYGFRAILHIVAHTILCDGLCYTAIVVQLILLGICHLYL